MNENQPSANIKVTLSSQPINERHLKFVILINTSI